MTTVSELPRALVIGDGIIGLATSVQLASRGVRVTLVAPQFHGAASPASAGMLAASVERTHGAAQALSDAGAPAWLRLRDTVLRLGGEAFGVAVAGILRIARDAADAALLKSQMQAGDLWLAADEVRSRIPALAPGSEGVLYAGNGAVDVPQAMRSLRRVALAHALIAVERSPACRIEAGHGEVAVELDGRRSIVGSHAVVATGAWSPHVPGLPRPIPVTPLRGSMIAVPGRLTPVPVYAGGGHCYLFPRGNTTLIGATSDDVGFAVHPGVADAEALLTRAASLFPMLTQVSSPEAFSGLRPMSPDGLGIIGPDPDVPRLLYATGHGRNGFLQAAVTAEVIAALILGENHGFDIGPFAPGRFIVQ